MVVARDKRKRRAWREGSRFPKFQVASEREVRAAYLRTTPALLVCIAPLSMYGYPWTIQTAVTAVAVVHPGSNTAVQSKSRINAPANKYYQLVTIRTYLLTYGVGGF